MKVVCTILFAAKWLFLSSKRQMHALQQTEYKLYVPSMCNKFKSEKNRMKIYKYHMVLRY